MFSQERTVTVIGQTPIKEEKVIPYEGNLQSLGETISNMNEKTNSEDVNRHGEGSNSSDNDINIHKKLQNIGSDNIKCENSIINQEKLPCSSRQLQLDYNNTEFSSKVSNQIDFVNDVAYTISKSENCDTPWRFVPFIRKVKLSLQSIGLKKDSDRPDELSHSLNIGGNRSEVDDGTHDRHAFLTDPKLDSVAKKPSTVPSAVLTTYHKLDVQSQHNDRTHTNDRIQQKIARVERELKLQKSLSEECEDLGVDEPSTSDLFPEADLLLDTNSSPSFDQALQDASCSHCVEPTENYENSSFKPIEYSSSSQEGSNQECSVAVTHTTDSVHKRSKKSHFDWKYGPQSERKRPRRNVAPKVQRIQESGSVTNLQCNNKCIRSDIASNSLEDSSNSYKDNSDVTSNNRLSKSIDNAKSLLSEDKVFLPELRNSGVKDYSSDKNLGKTGNKDSLEESLDTNLKNLSTNVNLKSKSVLGLNNKIIIATSPDDSTFCSSSEDSVTMLDSFSNNMIVSSLDVTIPSPLPALPSTVIQSNDLQETLPSLTSSHKYTNKYGKRTSTCRQDVRFSKRARPNKQNQYFHNDHVESQETWESSSSQDKVCADDEDSGSQSRTEDQPNSDVDIIEISNDAFSSSTSRFSPSPPPKLTIHNSQCQESALKSFNLNGIDLKVSVSNKNDTNKLSHKRLITKRHVDQSELECSAVENLMISKGMDTEHFNHLSKFNSVIHLNSSKTRASLRGHIKKGCTCCSISSQPKKKKELIKIEKPARKTSPVKQIVKGIFSKKR